MPSRSEKGLSPTIRRDSIVHKYAPMLTRPIHDLVRVPEIKASSDHPELSVGLAESR
jgi:hypothetical protein